MHELPEQKEPEMPEAENNDDGRRFITYKNFTFEVVPDKERPGVVAIFDKGDPMPYRFTLDGNGKPESIGNYTLTGPKFAAMMRVAAGVLKDYAKRRPASPAEEDK